MMISFYLLLFATDVLGSFAYAFGQGNLLYLLAQEVLDGLETVDVGIADEGDGFAVTVGTGGTTNAVYIVLAVAGDIVVDDKADIVDVDTAGNDVGSYKHIGLTCLEAVHGFIALGLREVRVHLVAVDVHGLELAGYLFDALLLAREDDDTLQVSTLEYVLDDLQFLRLVANVGHLVNFLSRAGYGYLYIYRIVQQLDGQFANLLRHGGREHDALAVLGQLLDYLHDVVDETHVEHAVGLVEHKEAAAREVEVAHLEVAEQSAWRGNQHIGTHTHGTQLLVVAVAVVATVYGYAAHIVEIVAEALHSLIYLLGELACGRHDDGVDGILGIATIVELREYRQQVGGSLAGSRLRYTQHIVAIQNLGNAPLLDGCHIFEVHVVERIENIIA